MRTLLLASAATLTALAAAPALMAQNTMTTATVNTDGTVTLTTEQQATFDTWPADLRTQYEGWPADARAYFWTLTSNQQAGWWRLTDEQRAQILAMSPEARVAAWTSIEAQMAASPPRATPAEPNPGAGEPATPATPSPRATVVDNTLPPPPASAMNKDYPVCSRTIQDSCQNPGEGGAPGRSRALKYWPGKPASEGGR